MAFSPFFLFLLFLLFFITFLHIVYFDRDAISASDFVSCIGLNISIFSPSLSDSSTFSSNPLFFSSLLSFFV